jgi:hypothetical protein
MISRLIGTCLLALIAAGAVAAAEPPPAPSATTQKASPAASATTREAQPAVKTSTPGSQPQAAQPQVARRGQSDRLELDTTVVTGNRELPKVLYIVPWKKADIGELPAQPFNTLLDEVLTPVDRDVFRREVTYYDAVSAGAPADGGAGGVPPDGPPGGSEK